MYENTSASPSHFGLRQNLITKTNEYESRFFDFALIINLQFKWSTECYLPQVFSLIKRKHSCECQFVEIKKWKTQKMERFSTIALWGQRLSINRKKNEAKNIQRLFSFLFFSTNIAKSNPNENESEKKK